MWGNVQLDGSNPTPVNLSAYLSAIEGGTVSMDGTGTPGDDPVALTNVNTGANLNVYAWKHDGTDPTLVASTDNARIVNWIAIGMTIAVDNG